MAVGYRAVGTASLTNGSSPVPALPFGNVAGDINICVFHSREVTDGTVSMPAGWTQIVNERTAGGLLAAWWRAWQSGDTNPTCTVVNHTSSTTGDSAAARIFALTGADTTNPIHAVGTIGTNAAALNIGPMAGVACPANGMVIVFGGKLDDFTSVATLSGDGLTWSSIFASANTAGNDNGLVAQRAPTPSGITTTAKTFAVTGGTSVAGKGVQFSVKELVAGTQYQQSVSGDITPAGDPIIQVVKKLLPGSIASSGAVSKFVAKSLAGGITPAGTVRKLTSKYYTGGITPSGTVAALKLVIRQLTGGITPTGALLRRTTLVKTGTITPTGAVTKRDSKFFTGAITPTGLVTKRDSKFFTGAITPTGTVAKRPTKTFTGATTPTGTITKRIATLFTGAVTSSADVITTYFPGTLPPVVYTLELFGTIASSGVLSKFIDKKTAGSVEPTGISLKSTAKQFTGGVTPVGIASRFTSKSLESALEPEGNVYRGFSMKFTGSIGSAGEMAKTAGKVFSSSVASSGLIFQSFLNILVLEGEIASSGAMGKSIRKALGGTLGAARKVIQVIFDD